MNAIDTALRNITFSIPNEILELAFNNYADVTHRMISLDERIRNTIIIGKVWRDCNIVGGTQLVINLEKCKLTYIDRGEFIIDVPKELTQGRSIIECLGFVPNTIYNHEGYVHPTANSLLSYGTHMFNNLATHNYQQTSKIELLGDNVVYVNDPSVISNRSVMRVNVEYDKNLSDIEPSLYLVLADLCLYATQAYIFNHLRVKLDKGYIHAGYELSIIRDIVESYSDAGEMYKEELKTKFMPGAYSTEKETMVRHIRAMISNNW